MSVSKHRSCIDEVKIKHSLNKKEEEFVSRRKNTVLQCLQKFNIRCSQDAVPNIALLGSGGGQRAMVGLLGSLVELHKAGLLDCILYLSGVSGSTWCMASLYQEPDWSTKLDTMKDKIIERLSGPEVSWSDAFAKLKNYYSGKEFFSLTDVWAAMFVTSYVKEIDEQTLTDQWNEDSKDPFPIYTVIDKHCKQREEGDPWVEISPLEVGYSLTGAFVDSCNFGSQFHEGSKKNHQDEFDMLYLQAVCSSALADGHEIWKWIKDNLPKLRMKTEEEDPNSPPTDECCDLPPDLWERNLDELEGIDTSILDQSIQTTMTEDPNSPPIDKCYQLLMDLVDMNLADLEGIDTFALDQSIQRTMADITGEPPLLRLPGFKIQNMKEYTMDVINSIKDKIKAKEIYLVTHICSCLSQWVWGRNYNFLHNMTDEAVPTALQENETRDYIDAGLLNNSPYFSVLREKRSTDLIISLDFSEGDPFMTVRETAEMCKKLNVTFPEVNIPSEDLENPKDFYVFKGQNAPTVIHMPLFNVVNCGDKIDFWRKEYRTTNRPYSAEEITELMTIAGKNISNNVEKLLEQIRAIAKAK